MSLIEFKSNSEIEKNRELERQTRENILAKAKWKYEKELQREKEAEKRGETTWMLPAIEDKLSSVKKKKKKKHKKKSKKKELSSSSESEDGNDSSAKWVEKSVSSAEQVRRDEWMEMPCLFKTQTREQMKIADGSSRALKKLEERKRKEEANKPGTHPLELNPFYKDGGTGLPSTQASSTPASARVTALSSSYDASWLKKALQRAKDKAAQEGRSLEEVAKERWGSLETFYKLLNEAEGKSEAKERDRKDPVRRAKSRSRSRERRRRRSKSRSKSKDRRSKSKERDKMTRECRSRSRDRNINRDRSKKNKSRSRSRSRGKDRRSSRKRARSDSSGSRSSSSSSSTSLSMEHCSSRRRSDSNRSSTFKRQSSASDRESSKGFLKPGDDMEKRSETNITSYSKFESSSSSSSWRKKAPEVSHPSTKLKPPVASDSHDSSSESSSESEEEACHYEQPTEEPKVDLPDKAQLLLTDKEMNQLAAKLTKAELLGNEVQVAKLRSKLEAARTAREHHEKRVSQVGVKDEEEEEKEEVILTTTNKRGFTRPVSATNEEIPKGKKKKKNKVNVFDADGKRTSYFADDFKVDLQSMFEKEKTTSAADQIAALEKLSCANVEKLSDDFDVDDMFISKVAPKESGIKEKERERLRAIWEHQRMQKTLDSCHFCVGNKLMKKHLIVALGTKCYLSVPAHQSLTEGHCLIVPLHHVPCSTQADEDLWQEITNFRQALVRAFSSDEMDCIFFESASKLHQTPHMVLHCVPLPKETGELAPIYFKKAILECDEEWAQNKKLIDLKGRNVRQAVPKELPYFFVDFGLTPGFAHVVENDRLFPENFAQEIIGGMIDADFSLFRKPKLENFDAQRKKVLKFAEFFKPFDPTV